MVVSVKIGLLFKDTRFLPSGSDISDTCLRHSHLHESYAYYIAPTCWLPRELSSSVAGNNSKLLLLVICHPASAIIYVHRTIVFRPTGHFVCLRFQLYDARSGEHPPMPSEPKPGVRREAPLQMNVSLPSPNWIRETRRETHGLPVDRVREGYMWTKTARRVIGMVCISEELIRKGTSLITAVWRGGSRFAGALSSASSTCSRSGREGEVSDMTSSEVSMSGTAGDWGRNQCRRGRNTCLAISHEMQPGTNWTGPAGSLNRPKPAEQQGRGETGRGWGMWRVWRGLWGARSFYLTGCFINVIKHGRALWLCIIPDLHSGGKGAREGGRKSRERQTGGKKEGRRREGVCRRER